MVIVETKYLAPYEVLALTDKKFKIAQDSRFEQMTQRDGTTQNILVVPVMLSNEKVKDWIPNETSKRKLVLKYGPDTLKWIGKTEEFDVMKQNVRGEIKDVIYLKQFNMEATKQFVCNNAVEDAIKWLEENKDKIHDGGQSAKIMITVA